jgi:hypothetical protein
MQNIQYLKDQDAVIVPIQYWKKLQNELLRLKKRVNKADILTDFKKSLTKLKKDLQNENYGANREISADDFLAQLKEDSK